LDIRGADEYFIAPDSLHPGGTVYYDETPLPVFELDDLSALAWLNLEIARQANPWHKLPDLAWRLLKCDRATVAEYQSRSHAEAALCGSLIRAGCTFSEAMRLFRRFDGPGKFAEMDAQNSQNALRYLSLTWSNVTDWIAGLGENEAGTLAKNCKTWALSRSWSGRGASSDRAVYLAHCDIVLRCGKHPYHASARELAEKAGVNRITASRANKRLVTVELLELESPGSAVNPHRWNLVEQRVGARCDISSQGGEDRMSHLAPTVHNIGVKGHISSQEGNDYMCTLAPTVHTSHDAFRFRGLNKSGAEVFAVMEARQEATVNELAEATGRHRTTVTRKLLQMYALALVEPLGDGLWQINENADLDQAARELNTSGTGKEQRSEHIRQRRGQKRWATGR